MKTQWEFIFRALEACLTFDKYTAIVSCHYYCFVAVVTIMFILCLLQFEDVSSGKGRVAVFAYTDCHA